MHGSWLVVGLMGLLALVGSLLARARRLRRHAPILLEERPIVYRRCGRGGSDWEW